MCTPQMYYIGYCLQLYYIILICHIEIPVELHKPFFFLALFFFPKTTHPFSFLFTYINNLELDFNSPLLIHNPGGNSQVLNQFSFCHFWLFISYLCTAHNNNPPKPLPTIQKTPHFFLSSETTPPHVNWFLKCFSFDVM